ncbi:MAG: hypothetical protein MZW92_74895 [Comamonadaceae bacterium]|nr:hypothetical protein [Comamonadaceae bacterium]
MIGGGNSGVEAAIDLAGVVAHVTLLEFADQLQGRRGAGDASCRACPTSTIHTSAQTTEITGDGQQGHRPALQGPRQRRRARASSWPASSCRSACVPNTEWLKGTLELSRYGEIVIDAHGATSAARRVRRRRRDHGAVQADRHRRGRGREGGAVGLRPPDPPQPRKAGQDANRPVDGCATRPGPHRPGAACKAE